MLDYVFKQDELFWLDDLLPGAKIADKDTSGKQDTNVNEKIVNVPPQTDLSVVNENENNSNEVLENLLPVANLISEENQNDKDSNLRFKVNRGN